VAADLFGDADLQRHCLATRISTYPEGLVDWLRQTPCEAWLYTGALENHPALIDQLATVRPLLGNPGDVLRRVRDPMLLGKVLYEHGLPFPETRTSSAGLPSDGSWLVKNYQGSSGTGVEEFTSAIGKSAYYQQLVTGTPCSAVFAGPRLLGITRQLVGESWTGADRFQYCGSIAPWSLNAAAENQLRRLGEVLTAEFGLLGLFGVDFIYDGQNPWTIEVNPRYSAAVEIVERTQGINAIDWHIGCSDGLSLPSSASAHHGKAILFAKRQTVISDELTRKFLKQSDLADIPQAGLQIPTGHPVLTVLATAESDDRVIGALRDRIEEIEAVLPQLTSEKF